MRTSEVSYRADIDGLRGIAVLAVLAYHYWGGLFKGGYVGVDVFFVLSGYLITGNIYSELQTGRFTLNGFYARRVRRILPALVVLLVACAAISWLALLPSDAISFARSMAAASLSISNFYFWKSSNYFDAPAAVRPLLHTWSLAVEEQFYLFFPLFLSSLHRSFRKQLGRAVVFAALASFVFSIFEVRHDPGAAFFLPVSRAWELLLGTILALGIVPAPRNNIFRELLGVTGLLAIGVPVFVFNVNTPFPGERALFPCIGACFIILTGQGENNRVRQILSIRPLIFIGLISYSLYLWHWPLLVFSKIAVIRNIDSSTIGTRFILMLVALAVSALSWRFIETPFRFGRLRLENRFSLGLGGLCIVLGVFLASVLTTADRWHKRFPASATEVAAYLDYKGLHPDDFRAAFGPGACNLDRRQPLSIYDERSCLEGVNGEEGVLIFGDSHAANLRGGLQSAFPNTHFFQATSASCPPLMRQNSGSTSECQQFTDLVTRKLILKHSIKTVLLNAFWNASDLDNLGETISFLKSKGVGVIVLGPFPVYRGDLPRLLSLSILSGRIDEPQMRLDYGQFILDQQMRRKSAEDWHVRYVSPMTLLCPDGQCVRYAGPGIPMEFDGNHLTLEGSSYLANAIKRQGPGLFDIRQTMTATTASAL